MKMLIDLMNTTVDRIFFFIHEASRLSSETGSKTKVSVESVWKPGGRYTLQGKNAERTEKAGKAEVKTELTRRPHPHNKGSTHTHILFLLLHKLKIHTDWVELAPRLSVHKITKKLIVTSEVPRFCSIWPQAVERRSVHQSGYFSLAFINMLTFYSAQFYPSFYCSPYHPRFILSFILTNTFVLPAIFIQFRICALCF